MKLLFYDKFFESLISLPKGIQKKVIEFQAKFKANSKSSGIHLESISTFKDKSFRSARIDQTYRAIIKAPESGDVFYLLWVDHHDEAYRWAANKMLQWNDETHSMQMFTAPEETLRIQQTKNANIQAEPFLATIGEEKLLKIGVPKILLPSVTKIDTIDALEEVENYIPTDVFESLFYLMDGANIDHIIYEIEEGKAREKAKEDKENSINNQRCFIELTDDSLFNEVLSGNLDKWKHYLHPSQRKLVAGQFKGSVKVSGGAGTGKTVAALHRLKFLAKHKNESETVLFTTFTNALAQNLQHSVKGFGITDKNITISTIDTLTSKLISKYSILEDGYKVFEFHPVKNAIDIWEELVSAELTQYSPEFLEAEYTRVILYHNVNSLNEYIRTSRKGRGKPISRRQRTEIWSYVEKFRNIKQQKNLFYKDELYNILSNHLKVNNTAPYDYCIVDELQDFSNIELRLIRSLVIEKANDIFMVGDPLQKIYDRHINFSNVGISVRGKRSRRLRINYRTTEEIKKLAFSVIQDCHYDNFDGEEESKSGYVSLFHGNKPTYQVFKTKNEEIELVLNGLNDIRNNEYRFGEIAICARTKDGLKDFRNALHNSNIPYTNNDNNISPDSVALLTFHKIKGLEFKHVFIVDANERTIPKLPFDFKEKDNDWQENYLRSEKSLLYVAVSRAIENVAISGVGNKSGAILM